MLDSGQVLGPDPVMPKTVPTSRPASVTALPSAVPTRVPVAFDDAVVWAAWLYYSDQMNQSEVAKALNVSRATVVNLLQEARETGVVNIRLRTDLMSRTVLAGKLVERYGLVEALVIPSHGSGVLVDRLGVAAARVLADQVRPGDVIGVAWGRTVLAAARAITLPGPVSPLTVVQVAGSSTSSEDFSPELCTSLLASRLGARCVNLLAPSLLSSAELRNRLLAEPMLVNQFELIHASTRILFGVGELKKGGTVRRSGFLPDAVVERYVAEGARAAIISRFIGAGGGAVPGELDERMIGIGLDELRSVPVRICVAGGPAKHDAILAALAGGYATHFVTDVETATRLVD